MADFKIIIIGLLTIFIAENLYAPVGQGKKLLEKQQLELENEQWLDEQGKKIAEKHQLEQQWHDEEYRRLKLIQECNELLKKERYRTGHNDGLNNFKRSFLYWSVHLIREKYMKPEYARYENEKEKKLIYREYDILLGYFNQLFREHKIDLSSKKLPVPWCKTIQAKKVQTDLQKKNKSVPFEDLVEKCIEYVFMILDIKEHEINTLTVPIVFQILYEKWSEQTLNYKIVVGELPQNLEPDEINKILLYFQEFGVGYYSYFAKMVDNLILIAARHGRFLSVNQFCDQPNLYENVKAIIGESSTMTSNETNTAEEQRLKYEDENWANQCIEFLKNEKYGTERDDGVKNFIWSFSNISEDLISEKYKTPQYVQPKISDTSDNKHLAHDVVKMINNLTLENPKSEKDESAEEIIYLEYDTFSGYFHLLLKDFKLSAILGLQIKVLSRMQLPEPWCKLTQAPRVKIILYERLEIREIIEKLNIECVENINFLLKDLLEKGENPKILDIIEHFYKRFTPQSLNYETVTGKTLQKPYTENSQKISLYFKEFAVGYYEYLQNVLVDLLDNQVNFTCVVSFCGQSQFYESDSDMDGE